MPWPYEMAVPGERSYCPNCGERDCNTTDCLEREEKRLEQEEEKAHA